MYLNKNTTHNSTLQQLAASHLSTEKCFTESSSLIDKFVHQNRQLLQAAKRCV